MTVEKLTEQRDGQNVIALRQDGKRRWAIASAGMGEKSTRFLYGEYADKLAEYESIGTPEECRAWKEKQNAKKVISFDYNNGTVNYGCPVCKRKIISKIDGKWCGGTFNKYCDRCGQKLDWRNEDEDKAD